MALVTPGATLEVNPRHGEFGLYGSFGTYADVVVPNKVDLGISLYGRLKAVAGEGSLEEGTLSALYGVTPLDPGVMVTSECGTTLKDAAGTAVGGFFRSSGYSGTGPLPAQFLLLDENGAFIDSWRSNATPVEYLTHPLINKSITGPGYRLYVTMRNCLRKLVTVSPLVADTLNVELTCGDIDRDNAISVFDYSILSDYFDRSSTDASWNVVGANGFRPSDADLDGDSAVTVFDYSILSTNFDQVGD